MKKYTELELRGIIEKHSLWLAGDPNGERADLSGADLREADFGGANLSRSDLSGASLRRANLSGANLSGATLNETNLSWSSLRGADLFGANLNYAKLYGVDLYGAHLYLANLVGANLSGANLREANLREANLYLANLNGANLSGANLSEVKFIEDKDINYPMNCPEKGSFIGFKKVSNNLIVELEITEDALRSSATGRKCRCSKAKVLSITNIDGTDSNSNYAVSLRDPAFVYTVGKTVEVPDFDTNRWNECAPGIHFFISRQEAVDFNV